VPLVIELKSRFDGNFALATRAADVLKSYAGPAALMSFDPAPVAALREIAPSLPRGIVAERHYEDSEWSDLSDSQEALACLPHPCAAHAAALRRLPRDGPALPWPVDCTQYPATAAARLDGAQRGRPDPRQTLGRPDDFRGLQALTGAHGQRASNTRRAGDR
jgi:hypothetical protein